MKTRFSPCISLFNNFRIMSILFRRHTMCVVWLKEHFNRSSIGVSFFVVSRNSEYLQQRKMKTLRIDAKYCESSGSSVSCMSDRQICKAHCKERNNPNFIPKVTCYFYCEADVTYWHFYQRIPGEWNKKLVICLASKPNYVPWEAGPDTGWWKDS